MTFIGLSKDELMYLVEVIKSQAFVIEARLEFTVDKADDSIIDRDKQCQSSIRFKRNHDHLNELVIK